MIRYIMNVYEAERRFVRKMMSRCLIRTLRGQMAWVDVFEVLKERSCQPIILYLAKLAFENEGEIKTFPVNRELREFLTTIPACSRVSFRLE